jgi:3-hydroxyisobutyrate dehydrogenase-like beta-hydroxyacid dehydrogenase
MAESDSSSRAPQVAMIGFGEAGERFARARDWRGYTRGWDIRAERRAAMREYGIETGDTPEEALAGAEIAISLVTADAAVLAARQYAALLPEGALWCDMNSVAPDTKREAAEVVEAAGGLYVDVAIMAPVDAELAVPLLVAGPDADAAVEMLRTIGFLNVREVGDEVGKAAAIKLIRSVMVKGIEALSDECAAAARAAGVYDEVVASLDASESHAGWADRIEYNLGRMELHGMRRAAEMEESARTLEGLGVEPVMTRSTVRRQREAATKNENERTPMKEGRAA